jgi:signal transduction histidine kinase
MPAAIYACDTDGSITYYNRQAIDLWGRKPEVDCPPWSFLDSRRIYNAAEILLRPEDAPVRVVLATGVPIANRELILERADFSRINVLANITPLRDSSGAVTGVVSIFQDITQFKRAQQDRELLLQELERSNRDLAQFAWAVSHDLKAPVRSIRSFDADSCAARWRFARRHGAFARTD